MEQNEIRDYNNQQYTKAEGAAIIKELNDRTKYDNPDYNSMQSLGEKMQVVEEQASAALGGYRGAIAIADVKTEVGFYQPTESGPYPNCGGLVVDLAVGLTTLGFDGTQWSMQVVPLTTNGVIEEGETQAVSGETVFNAVDFYTELISSSNLVDKTAIVLGEIFNNTTGVPTAYAGRGRTEQIEVEENTVYSFAGAKPDYTIAIFWTAAGAYLGYANVSGLTEFTTPANTGLVGLNFADSGASAYVDTLQMNIGDEVLLYEEFYKNRRIFKESSLSKQFIDVATIIEYLHSSNLVDKTAIVLDSTYDNATGIIYASAGRGRTEQIEVEENTVYSFAGAKIDYTVAVFWNAAGAFISSFNASGLTEFTTPANTVKVGLNFANSGASTYVDTLQMNIGDEVLPYEDFYEGRIMVKSESLPEGGGGGEAYDQQLNTTDSVEFASLRVSGLELDLPISASGLSVGQAWIDTTNGNVIKIVQ